MIKITNNEKAFMAGLLAFLVTTVVQLQRQPSGYTLRNFEYSAASWVLLHLGVWLTTNTPKTPPVVPPQA